MTGIYLIIAPNNKFYIGQSVNIEDRIRDYKYVKGTRQFRLYRSFEKFGYENHTFSALIECDKKDLDQWERFYIKLFDTFGTNHGLNLREGGSSRSTNSPETIQRMRIAQSKKIISEETKARLRLYNLGKVRPQHEKDKISESMKKIVKTEDHKNNLAIAIKNSIKSKEQRNRLQEERKVKVRDTDSGIVYNSIKEAAKLTGIKYSSLCQRLNGFRKNTTNLQLA